MSRRGRIAAAALAVMLLSVGLFFAFREPIADAMAGTAAALDSSKSTPDNKDNDTKPTATDSSKSDEEDAERHIVFLTYSDNKLGRFNFFDDCYAKAEQAVKDGKYKTIDEYVFDLDFDKNAYKKAEKEVADKKAETIVEAMSKNPDSGKPAFLLYFDPAFTAAWACALDQYGISGVCPILKEEQELPVDQRPNAALQRFMKNQEDWDYARDRIIDLLWGPWTKQEIKEMSDYTSGMYMYRDGVEKGIPSIIVRKTTNAGGHFALFTVEVEKDVWKTIRFRLECGYQPVDVPDIPVPPSPPIPDNPTPEPKDPANDPQNAAGADQHEFYSPDRINHDPDTTETPEPTSPTKEYVAPTPPASEETKPATQTPTQTPTTTPVTPAPQSEASKDTKSGSKTQDTDNGKTEVHDGKTYDVEAGNGKNNGDLGEIADPSNPDKPPVEDALADDPINTIEVTDFE